jgi:hypothetical protein
MNSSANLSSPSNAHPVARKPAAEFKPAPVWTVEERAQRIEAIGQRINGYVQYMCRVASLDNISGEAKERALTVFYEKMVAVEKQLSHVHDQVRLL